MDNKDQSDEVKSLNRSTISRVNQNTPSNINWETLRKHLNQDSKNQHAKSLWGFVNEQQNNKGK